MNVAGAHFKSSVVQYTSDCYSWEYCRCTASDVCQSISATVNTDSVAELKTVYLVAEVLHAALGRVRVSPDVRNIRHLQTPTVAVLEDVASTQPARKQRTRTG
jgi:hypothetical protein